MVLLQMLFAQVVNEFVVERLQPNAAAFGYLRNMIARGENIRITEDEQRTCRRAMHQIEGGFEHGDARAFRSHERASDVKAIFRKQFVQIQTRYAPGDSRKE